MNMQRVFAMGLRWVVVSLGVVMLSSCGGGGGGGVPDADPTGYYDDTGVATIMTDTASPVTIDAFQGIFNKNKITLFNQNNNDAYAYVGTITVSGNSFSGTVSVYHNGVKQSEAPIDGTITQGTTITGSLAGTGAGKGTFILNYNNKPLAASLTVFGTTRCGAGNIMNQIGCFDITNGMITPNSQTTFNGTFFGCDASSGTVAPITGTSLYNVTITLTGCTNGVALDGVYSGLAATYSDVAGGVNIALAISMGNYSVYGLHR